MLFCAPDSVLPVVSSLPVVRGLAEREQTLWRSSPTLPQNHRRSHALPTKIKPILFVNINILDIDVCSASQTITEQLAHNIALLFVRFGADLTAVSTSMLWISNWSFNVILSLLSLKMFSINILKQIYWLVDRRNDTQCEKRVQYSVKSQCLSICRQLFGWISLIHNPLEIDMQSVIKSHF